MTTLDQVRTIYFEEVKVRRVSLNRYRICDMQGQGSQYENRWALPKDVCGMADAGEVVHAYGYIAPNGRWSVRTRKVIEGMRKKRHFKSEHQGER